MIKQKTHRDCLFCGTEFRKSKTTDKYCSMDCHIADNESSGRKGDSKPKKHIAPVSEKRLKQLAEYRKAKKEFMSQPENQICPVTGDEAHEIHHTNGRENEKLNDTEYWIAVSRRGHTWIHENPKEAREKGWLI
jgi:hypothetical protein